MLDQKKAEWKALLNKAAELEHAIPTLVSINEGIDCVEQKLPAITRELLQCWAECLFIKEFLSLRGNQEKLTEFLKSLGGGARTMRELGEAKRCPETPPVDRLALLEKQKALHNELRGIYIMLQEWLVEGARQDLGVVKPETPSTSA